MLDMSLGELSALLAIVQAVLTVAVGLFAYYMRTAFFPRREAEVKFTAIDARLTAQSERLNSGDARFTLIESQLQSLPTAANLHELALGIERLAGDMRAMGARLEGIEALHETLKHHVSVMDEFLRTTK